VPTPQALSKGFVLAAVRQRESLQQRVQNLRSEAEALRAKAESLEAKADLDERLLRELDDVLDLAPQLRVDLQTEDLRGQRLREVAIEILRNELGTGESIHYREWFRLVRAAGHRVAGKDPIASFLTQVSRSNAVEPVGARSGLYRLRVAA
jgi:predicted RNase H-like nuclease (RuvC/YqgF family)